MLPSIGKILILFALCLSARLVDAMSEELSPAYQEKMEKLFFDQGRVSEEKLDLFEQKIDQRLLEVRTSMENYLRHVEGRPAYWARWEANTEYPVAYFHQIKKMVQKMRSIQNRDSLRKLAWKILIMESATKVIGSKNKAFFFENWESGEFKNLSLEKAHSDEAFQSKDIHKWFGDFDKKTIKLPELEKFQLAQIESYSHRPLFHVNASDAQNDYLMHVGPGIYAEATSSQLLAHLGFHSYSSYVRKNVHLSLGEMSLLEFKKKWAESYDEETFVIEDHIKDVSEDENGQTIIIWKRALIQKKPDLKYVGPWSPFENDLMSQREMRSLALYSIWTNNTRVAQFRGRDLYWNPQSLSDDNYEFSYQFLLSGLEHSFGSVQGERPGALAWDIIKKNKEEKITFNYKGRGLKKFEMSWSDARWMTWQIGKLSRAQIEQSVKAGGWPKSVEKLLVEKLINRRNQLICAFELENDLPILKVQRHISTADKAVIAGELIQEHFSGHSQGFGSDFHDLMKPILGAIKNTLFSSTRSLISSFSGLDINPIEIGIDSSSIYRIIFGFNRTIEKNLEPTGDDDIYLVKDTFKIGLRLGAGLVLSGDIAYVKEYNLVYPVASKAQGQTKNNFLVNLLLPLQVHTDNLPKRHVLVVENYLEGRGRLKLGNSFTGIGTFFSASQINLSRTYLSRTQNDKAYLFEDSSLFTELAHRINLELGAVGIPVFNSQIRQGNLERVYYELDLNNKDHTAAIASSLKYGSNTRLKKISVSHKIETKFLDRHSYFNFLGLIKNQVRTRYDDITEFHMNDPQPGEHKLMRRYQLEQLKRYAWTVGLSGEDKESRVTLLAQPPLQENKRSGLEGIKNPSLQIQLNILDKSTTTKELQRYIEMINKVALNDHFINFDPSHHSRNNLWGETEVFMTLNLYQEAIEKLMEADEETYWKTLAQITNRSQSYWAKALTTNLRNQRHLDITNRDSFLASRVKSMIRHFKNVGKERSALARMRSIHSALSQAVYNSDKAYRATILAMVHKIAGSSNVSLSAYIAVPEDQENHLPGKIPLTNESGKKQEVDDLFYQFVFENASEIYNAFKF